MLENMTYCYIFQSLLYSHTESTSTSSNRSSFEMNLRSEVFHITEAVAFCDQFICFSFCSVDAYG
jgi:hypothetical protein